MHILYMIHINNQSSESRTHSCLLITCRVFFCSYEIDSWNEYLGLTSFFCSKIFDRKTNFIIDIFWKLHFLTIKVQLAFLWGQSQKSSSKLIKVAFSQKGLMRLSFLQTAESNWFPELEFWFFHCKGLKSCQIRTWSCSECSKKTLEQLQVLIWNDLSHLQWKKSKF